MVQASARLLKLLTLLQARSTWAGPELASRLEITHRTLRRDIERLRTLGYPILGETGVGGGYRLGTGASLPPLSLDDDEAIAVFVGLHTAAGTGVTGANTSATRALSKLEHVLPLRLKKQLKTLKSSVLSLADRAPGLSLANVSALATACSERIATRLTYTARDRARSERTVEPHQVVRVGLLWYLVAWEAQKNEWRTFRLDRIARLELLESEHFKPRSPPGGDLAEFVTRSLSTTLHACRAKVLLLAPLEVVRPRIGPQDGVFRRASRKTCTMELGAPTLDVLTARILWLGVDFKVLEPASFREHLKRVARRVSNASSGQAPRRIGNRER
ncbi:MAG: YafY family protein [Archangium sp.]